MSGPETVSLRWVAQEFAKRLGVQPNIVGQEADTALLSNSSKAHATFGYPRVSLLQMIDWIAEWVLADGKTWNKPTHFQEREGKY
jgi:nucleoside-diphosphate-sugar epimerase